MKILEDLNIIVTKEFVEGRRVNGRSPIVLSEPVKYTPRDLESFDKESKINSVFLNNDEVLVVASDFSCSIVMSGFDANPTGIVLHGDESNLIDLLSILNGQLEFTSIRLQYIESASKRAVLSIYRAAFKTVEDFFVVDKKGKLHIATIIMDLDKLSYSTDSGVNLDTCFRLLHSDLEVVKVDRVSRLFNEELSFFERGGLEFHLTGVSRITRGALKSRRTYGLVHNDVAIGDFEMLGRLPQKQIYINLNIDGIFTESELSEFKKALQRHTSVNTQGWVIILNYAGEEKMVNEEVSVGDDVDESTTSAEETIPTETTEVEKVELSLDSTDKPYYWNFTDVDITSGDIKIVAYDGEGLHDRLLMGAIVDFKSPIAAIRIIGDLLVAGVDQIYYLNGKVLEKYNVEGHVDSAESLIDNFRGRRRVGRDYGDLSHRNRR